MRTIIVSSIILLLLIVETNAQQNTFNYDLDMYLLTDRIVLNEYNYKDTLNFSFRIKNNTEQKIYLLGFMDPIVNLQMLDWQHLDSVYENNLFGKINKFNDL
ncbi:MAG: hypothetical protein K8R53_05695, partial [Bacteroidales bacterium]|nr:hypothetical protein [Bacteroidales bacterium]